MKLQKKLKKEGSTDIRKQLKSIRHKFLNHVEVSAQEAVYFILQLPPKNSSREVVFVNTSPESEIVIMLKSQKLIERLPDESTDVETKGIIQRCAERPRQRKDLCLADNSSWFKVVYRKTSTFIEDDETEKVQVGRKRFPLQKPRWEKNKTNNQALIPGNIS